MDNGGAVTGAYAYINNSGTVFTLLKAAGAAWTGALGKSANFSILYEIG